MSPRAAAVTVLDSGAHLAPPECDVEACTGSRLWPLPAGGEVLGHCWCRTGRRAAELAYARRHHLPAPVEVAS